MLRMNSRCPIFIFVRGLTILVLPTLALLVLACSNNDFVQPQPETSSVPDASTHQSPTSQMEEPKKAKPSWWPDDTPDSQAEDNSDPILRRPSPVPQIQHYLSNPIWEVSPSIDEQILVSDIIVLASFASAAAGVETVPGEEGVAPTYRPLQILTFRATEYLKGSGPTEFAVEVSEGFRRGGYLDEGQYYEGYLSEAKALESATESLAQRNTVYDDRPGVLFLMGPLDSAASSESEASGTGTKEGSTQNECQSTTTKFNFVLSNPGVQSNFEYAIDTLSRTWLPAKEVPSGGASGSSGSSEFITDGTQSPPPVSALAALKTRIREIDAMLRAGEGTEGYDECIHSKLTRERYYRDWNVELYGREVAIDSGLESGSELYNSGITYIDPYNVYWVSGPDAEMFEHVIIDNDSIAGNGYYVLERTTRPLAAGQYQVSFRRQHHAYVVCNFVPPDTGISSYNVTVTAPAGTLHEAFFDPAAIGTAVGADATNGVLKPTSFTVGETATAMTGLKWENNQAVLTLSPHVSLSHHALDFIELDGSVSLTLQTDDATVDATAGTHTWTVATQPWHNGDKLMLRMRQAPKPPAFASDTYNFTVAENASSFTVIGTALATDPNEGDEVLHTIESGNDGNKFRIDGFAGFILVWGTLDYETKSTYTLSIKADDGKGGTDTATVTITVTDVVE